MNVTDLLALLGYGNQLKRTIRTGWYQRGIVDAENVAAHSYGVAFVCLAMADIIDKPVNRGKLLAMALLHDLPEALTSDIPAPAWNLLPPGSKATVELDALQSIVEGMPFGWRWLDYWEELKADESLEARLVHDSDKLDLYLQAYVYERQTGNRQLGEFWAGAHNFHFPETKQLYDQIASLREVE